MKYTLENGSKGKYKGFEKLYMPPLGKNLSQKEINDILTWITKLK